MCAVRRVRSRNQTRAVEFGYVLVRGYVVKRMFGLLVFLIVLVLPMHLGAWNETGHFVVASIAYDNLTASTKIWS